MCRSCEDRDLHEAYLRQYMHHGFAERPSAITVPLSKPLIATQCLCMTAALHREPTSLREIAGGEDQS